MPESPRTRFRAPRARRLGDRNSDLTARPRHDLEIRRGRSGLTGACSCGRWATSGSDATIRRKHAEHIRVARREAKQRERDVQAQQAAQEAKEKRGKVTDEASTVWRPPAGRWYTTR
jgi:hypothetical protein